MLTTKKDKIMTVNDCTSRESALWMLTVSLARLMEHQPDARVFNVALSGGDTAKQMFRLWASAARDRLDWARLQFFWVDERCVPDTDEESNYGQACRLLFKPLQISEGRLHHIRGEEDPEIEATRYGNEVERWLPKHNGIPRFDCIILGIGADLHTASIFPDSMDLLTDERFYAVSTHPQTGQKRITMTGTLLLNDSPILIPLLGRGKSDVADVIIAGCPDKADTPAAYILSKAKDVTIYRTQTFCE